MRPDALGHAEGRVHRRQRAALLDVQFDERADPAEQVVVGSEQAGVGARGGIAAASVIPSSSLRPRAASVMAPVIRRLPRHGTLNRAPSSSVKTAMAMARSGLKFLAFSSATAASADATPSAPS